MELETIINNDIKAAMLAKDADKLKALRAVKAEILLMKTSEKGGSITPDLEMKLLQKMVKQRKDSANIYTEQNRADLAEPELAEALVIEQYLPQQMAAEEIELVVKEIVASLGATSMKDMGKVMGVASKQLAGKADGHLISEIVKKILQ